jgi:recombinational DNA repair protein (RecF pathway)
MNYAECKSQLICIECNKPITDTPYSFYAPQFACEHCVRDYYARSGASAHTIELELRERAREAQHSIKRGRDLSGRRLRSCGVHTAL